MVTLRALVIACLITALVGAGGGMLGASLFAAASGPAGAQGPAGESGVDGADGANGADGVDGAPGQPGAPGAAGAAGPAGARGAAGPQGPAGATGAPGPQGTPGPQGEAGPQGAPGVVDFAYFAVGAQLVQPGTGITLPLTAVSGELDLELATGGSGGAGGVLTLQPGIYRFSTLLRVTSIDSVTPGALAIRTEYVFELGQPSEPLDNTSRIEFTPVAPNLFQYVSTGTTLVLESPTIVRIDLNAFVPSGGIQVERGWFLIERFG